MATIETETYLDSQGTEDQQDLFEATVDRIKAVYEARYPDSPEDMDGMIGDQLSGAAQFALGDVTLAEAGEALQKARRAYMEASDQLAGAMCVARSQGMSVSEIAAAANIRRSIVYKRTEA